MQKNFYLADTKPVDHDDRIDTEIRDCLKLGSGKSFITFAGAGSGKTYSLKKALTFLKDSYYKSFSRQGKQIAVVTFTNNAADEIKDRIEQNSIFIISTIHSFCWSAITGFNEDIRKWYLEKIPTELAELEDLERRGRQGKASDARKKTIIRLKKKMEWLAMPRTFIYDPNGINSSPNSLSHSDVLAIFSKFLTSMPMMSEIIASKYPFIFIDESQDTNKDVVNAFFGFQDAKSDKVVIGLFGDTMQRIFGGGESQLGKSKPIGWITFIKEMNHRSVRRIVGLGNQIRSEDDGCIQYAKDSAEEGYVRFFLLKQGNLNKDETEAEIRDNMAEITNDVGWNDLQSKETAILLLEHKMAGRRLGFSDLWDKLSKSERIKNRITEGTNTELNFFSNIVFPLAVASRLERRSEFMSILRENDSPVLQSNILDDNKEDPLLIARAAEHAFKNVIINDDVSFRDVLEVISEHNLLNIPTKLKSFVTASDGGDDESVVEQNDITLEAVEEQEEEKDIDEIDAWADALETNFYQVRNYKNYIDENSIFRTHQGVKGNEFERVMVIMDDEEAGGFLFSYDQYFGAKELSASSQMKRDSGEETGLDRTRRLFYVTSTRAKNSLAHVIYTSDVSKVRAYLIGKKYALNNEIIELK